MEFSLAGISAWGHKPLFALGGGSVSLVSLLVGIFFVLFVWWFAGLLEKACSALPGATRVKTGNMRDCTCSVASCAMPYGWLVR